MTKAIRIHETGGAEVLRYEDVEVGRPGPGEVRLKQSAIGLNFIDVYLRSGLYPLPSLPCVIGLEAAGTVEEVGAGVGDFAPGDRVAYASPPPGAYAEERLMPADRLVALPDEISDRQAAAMMLQGMTVEYLIRRTYRVEPSDTVAFSDAMGFINIPRTQELLWNVYHWQSASKARPHGWVDPPSASILQLYAVVYGGTWPSMLAAGDSTTAVRADSVARAIQRNVSP